MYKVNAENAQRRESRIHLSDLVQEGFEDLTPEQKRENLVAVWKQLSAQVVRVKDKDHKRILGKQIQLVQDEIRKIRPALRGAQGTAEHFLDVARENLTEFEFRRWLVEASRRADLKLEYREYLK